MTKKRVCVRLSNETLEIIDKNRMPGETRTACIERGLRKLHRRLALGKDSWAIMKRAMFRLRYDGQTRQCQLRLDTILLDYFNLNGLNVTTCIKLGQKELTNSEKTNANITARTDSRCTQNNSGSEK